MASFTDSTRSGSSFTDEGQKSGGEDTNVNRFTFAELILGDIILGLGDFVSRVSDVVGAALTVGDKSGSAITHTDETLDASITYNETGITYNEFGYTYNGVKVGPGFTDVSE